MKHPFFALFLALTLLLPVQARAARDKELVPIADSISNYLRERTTVRSYVSVEKATVLKDGTLRLTLGRGLVDYPLRDQEIKDIQAIASELLPRKYAQYRNKLSLYADKKPIEYYKSRYFSGKAPATGPVKEHRKYAGQYHDKLAAPLVRRMDAAVRPTRGLQNRHIAMWQSHGWYYEQSLKRWEWQRARIFETVEDLYTQSYVVPFLVPMLENAGAVVMLPRERDWNTHEIIVDNDDRRSGYFESGSWDAAIDSGFANPKAAYLYKENPFRMGTARIATTDPDGGSSAAWLPIIPESGEYAVYVSYQTVKNSTTGAQYEVRHKGGTTRFSVNQQMGGRTWIYLGRFPFEKGRHSDQGVFLSNVGDGHSAVTCDAVKFGGGMGNMARKPAEVKEGDFDVEPEISGYPRFTEGSRYWLQWAGFNDTIYSRNQNMTDYNDDYMSRGLWVNTLSDGSYLKPDKKGYNIPLDLSFAFHTDAGTTMNDSIVGTLAIYTRLSNDEEKYPNGEDRSLGRDMTDIIQTQIVGDIRALYEPQWSRRQLWDRSYAESRMPEVPGMLLELLSHQNLADMRYGLDPNFRFTVSRAIYKGMLKFLAWINDFEYTVQPLPVKDFEVHLGEEGDAVLSWSPVKDPLEATADATGYVLYTSVDGAGFDNGVALSEAHAQVPVEKGHLYRFKVTASNEGGESFPSETLALGVVAEDAPTVLVINNFDRVSAPVSFASKDSTYAGFNNRMDGGVPYLYDISYIGNQHEFRRAIPWMDDDSAGFGASESNYETKALAGNSFDYPAVHGKAWMAAGCNFVSASRGAVENHRIAMNHYTLADLICGEQLTTQIGRRGASELRYAVFPKGLREQIEDFTRVGGNILVSGAYVGSDLWEPVFDFELTDSRKADYFEPAQKFAQEVLHYRWMTNNAAVTGEVKGVQNPLGIPYKSRFIFNTELNDKLYCVESPDGLNPEGQGAYTIFRYAENNISAGVAYQGDYKTVILGFPVETLDTQEQVDCLIGEVARFFKR
ncbi:MAG: xanthan lyase [Bacteroidales bacterium]|nr:xanthan lyase [Bacteroidales bacterium]